MTNIKVGIVEDEMIIAQGIAKTIREIGYTACKPAGSYTDALEMIDRDKPDILLLDIVLGGHKDGIDLAWKIKESYGIPFIFLTANSDKATVERAKLVSPPAYLIKPFSKEELYTSIEICLYNFTAHGGEAKNIERSGYLINDCLYIKQGNKFIKVLRNDITHLESDRVYVTVYCKDAKFIVRSTIQNYMELIGVKSFIRVNRSFAINLAHLEAINPETVTVNGQEIPIGRTYRDELLNALPTG